MSIVLRDVVQLQWPPEQHEYDLYVFSSGFEERSTAIFERINPPPERCLVLGFSDNLNTLSRPKNDAIFRAAGLDVIMCADVSAYEELLRSRLVSVSQEVGTARTLKVFVDYSTMTRSWYGYLLTWAKYAGLHPKISMDLYYSFGIYERDFEPLHIRELCSVPGFEGHSSGARRSIALLGLGYDRYATLAVVDQIEPDSIVCFIAKESPNDEKAEHVADANREIIEMAGTEPVALPLGRVGDAFRVMHEYASLYGEDNELVAVPMGPKPHVLASLILSQVMPKVSCLHARGVRATPVPVSASGTFVGCRLNYL